jgi:hypothetical protein
MERKSKRGVAAGNYVVENCGRGGTGDGEDECGAVKDFIWWDNMRIVSVNKFKQ